jgi:hypothetical protein
MDIETTRRLRERIALSLSTDTANVAGCTLSELQQFVAGARRLSDPQLRWLAAHCGFSRSSHVQQQTR